MKATKVTKHMICQSCAISGLLLEDLVEVDHLLDTETDSTVWIVALENPDAHIVQVYRRVPSGSSCDYCDA